MAGYIERGRENARQVKDGLVATGALIAAIPAVLALTRALDMEFTHDPQDTVELIPLDSGAGFQHATYDGVSSGKIPFRATALLVINGMQVLLKDGKKGKYRFGTIDYDGDYSPTEGPGGRRLHEMVDSHYEAISEDSFQVPGTSLVVSHHSPSRKEREARGEV